MLLEELMYKSDLEITDYFSNPNNIIQFFKDNKNTEFYYPSYFIDEPKQKNNNILNSSEIEKLRSIKTKYIRIIKSYTKNRVVIIKKLNDNDFLVLEHNMLDTKIFSLKKRSEISINKIDNTDITKDIILFLEKLKISYISKYFKRYKKLLFLNQFTISILEQAAKAKNFEILHKSKTQLLFRIPEIIIKNSLGINLHTGSWLINITKEDYDFKYKITVHREVMTELERNNSYFHSHYNSIPSYYKANIFNFCLGDNNLSELVDKDYSISINSLYTAKTLVSNIYNFLSWESLEGGPYTKIQDLYINFFREKLINYIDNNKLKDSIIKSYFENVLIHHDNTDTFNILIEPDRQNILHEVIDSITEKYSEEFSNYLLSFYNNTVELLNSREYIIPLRDDDNTKTTAKEFKHYVNLYSSENIYEKEIISKSINSIIFSIMYDILTTSDNIEKYIQKIIVNNLIEYTTLSNVSKTTIATNNKEADFTEYKNLIQPFHRK